MAVMTSAFTLNKKIKMAILSEAKGVSMWLFNKTRNENFSQFILREFKKETEKSFYKITHQPCDGKKFKEFISWFEKQNFDLLKISFKDYQSEKEKKQKSDLEDYYKTESHLFIIENKHLERNDIYKMIKNKVKYSVFKNNYKKSKLIF